MLSIHHEMMHNRATATWAVLIGAASLLAIIAVEYRLADQESRTQIATAMTGGDPSLAPDLMRRFGCAGCHTIPGVRGADGKVGPRLEDLRERVFIAGSVPNEPENLIRWIVAPNSFAPHAAMPPSGVSEVEARAIAAYLYAH